MPFRDGTPSGAPIDVLTGFVTEDGQAMGRAAGVAIDSRGALLVADDVGNVVWRVAARPGSALLPVPSVIVPGERSDILNAAHADFRKLTIHRSEPFSFDPRMWKAKRSREP